MKTVNPEPALVISTTIQYRLLFSVSRRLTEMPTHVLNSKYFFAGDDMSKAPPKKKKKVKKSDQNIF
jgi:hypothetical protein